MNPLRILSIIALCMLLNGIAHAGETDSLEAFPGAEGFGKYATGGTRLPPDISRPIPINTLFVTSLADSGPGSLRAAVEGSGPRVVIFKVSGIIELESSLEIENGNITIAGQTAPGDGICISGYPFGVNADNVVIRFLRFRMGDANEVVADAAGISTGQRNIIFDHCSFSWAVDETFSLYAVQDVTVQWCFITESLYESIHEKGKHGYGSIWGGNGVSFHHNLFAHHTSRTPRFNGGRFNPSVRELVDYRNNVVYNWGFNSAYGGEAGAMINMVNNYYKAGPATRSSRLFRIVEPTSDRDMSGNIFKDEFGNEFHTGRWFVDGNHVVGNTAISTDNWAGGVQGKFADNPEIRMPEAFEVVPVPTESALEAYAAVLRSGGAVLPSRDSVDRRIVSETRTGTASFGGAYGAGSGIIDTPSDVGGYPDYAMAALLPDTDGDAIPDVWENANGLDAGDPTDAHKINPETGYSNLEHYLNALAAPAMPPPHRRYPELTIQATGSGVEITWAPEFAGYLLERGDLPSGWEAVPGSREGVSVMIENTGQLDKRFFRLRRP